MDSSKKAFWFRIDKWHNNKPDFCKVYAESEKEAKEFMADCLWYKGNVNCEYFSTFSKYKRKIDDIMNFYIVSEKEVQQHINKIEYAINKQKEMYI